MTWEEHLERVLDCEERLLDAVWRWDMAAIGAARLAWIEARLEMEAEEVKQDGTKAVLGPKCSGLLAEAG